ncbi:glutathione S-transferase [Mytilinidion resinicola]|uniref:Glutathione S-transferase n=1 Tax=Mytilinidion resinicola TaxID=574789 RepID=A0A6A6YQ75_9PEZI|nr:glutathione S-transferase [Mytilinidion resinicola]KAF2810669.1 glutathione S-transferase [Mytilinidion resinicola]
MLRKDIKKEPYKLKNPNGKIPTIEDPNTGITLFEPIRCYHPIPRRHIYEITNKLAYTTFPEKYLTLSWLSLQMSTHGTYFVWFHPEKNSTAAIDRYGNEMKRIVGVIDRHLKRTGTQYLIGDKCTYADLAFVMWDQIMPLLVGDWDFKTEAPDFAAWNERVVAQSAVQRDLAGGGKAPSTDRTAPVLKLGAGLVT